MADQEQTTTQTETQSSEETNSSQTQDQSSDTSNTETTRGSDDESVDLSKTEEKVEEKTETDEEKASREERETLFGAPEGDEKYVLEGLPEGTVIDEEALADIAPIAKELGLSNKGLSKIAGVYAEKVLPRVAQQVVSGVEADITAKRSEWEGQARDAIAGKGEPLKNQAGEALGFDGNNIKAVQATAAKALDKLAPAGFREFLDETGLSVHPAMVAFAYKAGQLLAEDTELETAETGRGKSTQTERFYGRK